MHRAEQALVWRVYSENCFPRPMPLSSFRNHGKPFELLLEGAILLHQSGMVAIRPLPENELQKEQSRIALPQAQYSLLRQRVV